MQGKQILFILVGVVIIFFGARYYTETAQVESECGTADLEPLPYCAEQKRLGSHLIVKNQCSFDITVHWDVTGGSDYLADLSPGAEKQIAAYPLKIQAVSCCPQYNRCF